MDCKPRSSPKRKLHTGTSECINTGPGAFNIALLVPVMLQQGFYMDGKGTSENRINHVVTDQLESLLKKNARI